MQRKRWFSLLLCGVGLVGCNSGVIGGNTNGPFLAEPITSHPTGLPLTLLNRYYYVSEMKDETSGNITLAANYGGMRYMPRQAATAGPKFTQFAGWDLLDVPGSSSNRSDWLRLYLNRPATLKVVWDKSALWLVGWPKEEITVGSKKYTVYTKTFGAGELSLGAPGAGNGEYWVLLAEGNGQPSAEPPLPGGISERPQPNQACPTWLFNAWRAVGPDGAEYPGWHPQIDPVYWCYYGYEHNSDPSLVGYKASFTYTANRFNNQEEPIEGFKGFAIRNGDLGWYINIHSETSTEARVCARFHTVVVTAYNWQTKEKLAELAYKGDFGASKVNEGSNPFFNISCKDPRDGQMKTQEQIAQETKASKRIREATSNSGYEQWDGGLNKALMEFSGVGMGIDIQNPATTCANIQCSSVIANGGSSSTRRTIHFSKATIKYDAAKDASDNKSGDGYFYTDPYGVATITPDAGGQVPSTAIKQFIKPGLNISLNGGFETEDAWRGLYVPNGHTQDVELEGSLGNVN